MTGEHAVVRGWGVHAPTNRTKLAASCRSTKLRNIMNR